LLQLPFRLWQGLFYIHFDHKTPKDLVAMEFPTGQGLTSF